MPEINSSAEYTEQVRSLLPKDREAWYVPRAQDTLKRTVLLERFKAIKQANEQVLGLSDSDGRSGTLHEDYEQSVAFVDKGFDAFESHQKSETAFDWAFLVPVRGEENQGDKYASEVTGFLPILDPRYGVGAFALQRTVAHLAPVKIEEYRGSSGTKGMIMFTPAYFDPAIRNYTGVEARDMITAARQRVSEAARLVRFHYGVGLVGLGAILPGVTGLGKSIKEPGLTTTTGHGGTVHLLSKTVEHLASQRYDAPTIGMLGLGSIGSSSLEVLQSTIEAPKYYLYDTNEKRLQDMYQADMAADVRSTGSEFELLAKADIIVTAITGTIDLDVLEAKQGSPLDLTGKIIVDDSQPGCFNREQVESRGGKLVWVVGADTSDDTFLHRVSGYTYGDEAGLYNSGSVWGCEAEAGALAKLRKPELAVRSHVTPKIAHAVGRVCVEAGIDVAKPLQSFGKPVDI